MTKQDDEDATFVLSILGGIAGGVVLAVLVYALPPLLDFPVFVMTVVGCGLYGSWAPVGRAFQVAFVTADVTRLLFIA